MMLNDDYRKLLESLFVLSLKSSDGVDSLKFRADNDQFLSEIDHFEHLNFIEKKDNRYFIRPLALVELEVYNSNAQKLISTCSCVFDLLRRLYKREPGKMVTVADLAIELNLAKKEVEAALQYLIQMPIMGGRSNDLSSDEAYVVPSENILKFNEFKALLAQMLEWTVKNNERYIEQDSASENKPKYLLELQTRSIEQFFLKPTLHEKLDYEIKDLINEICYALSKEMRALPSMGLRTVIDVVCNKLVGDCGGFSQKLNILVDKGYITSKKKEILENALEVGHASAHRGYFPNIKDLKIVIEIVESLLQDIYVLDDASKKLKDTTPKRISNKNK